MLKVLLIKPPYSRLKKSGQAAYFPLGLGYLAAVLDKENFDVKIYHAENPRFPGEVFMEDEEAVFYQRSKSQKRYFEVIKNDQHPIWNEIRKTLDDFKPDIVGISVLTVDVPSSLKVSEICKQYNSNMPVVWGGVHPTFLPEDVLQYSSVDFVVRGEGEKTFLGLCKNVEKKITDFSEVKGISYKKDGHIIHNPQQPLIEDLDTIPFPATHLILYPESFDYKSMGSMIASRGCPWRCTFCSSRLFWEKKMRFRSPENVVSEIKEIKERYGVRYVMFWDDSFSASRKTILRFCKKMTEAKLNVLWRTATRADLVDDEILYWMKKSGCVKLEIGVETGSRRMQKIINKDVDNSVIQQAFHNIKTNGIAAGAFFMLGFPEETLNDIEQTFCLMKDLPAEDFAYNIFDPMPGSELWNTCVKLGLVPRKVDFRQFHYWPDSHFMKHVSKEEFNSQAVKIGKWIYAYNNRLSNKFRRVKTLVLFLIVYDPILLLRKMIHHVKRRVKVRLSNP